MNNFKKVIDRQMWVQTEIDGLPALSSLNFWNSQSPNCLDPFIYGSAILFSNKKHLTSSGYLLNYSTM